MTKCSQAAYYFLMAILPSFGLLAQEPPRDTDPNFARPAVSQSASRQPRLKNFLYDAFGSGAFVSAGILAARDQDHDSGSSTKLHGEPPEWGQGAEGYGERLGSRFGQVVISNTTRYGIGALLREDVTYHRCECAGFLPRLGHVVIGSYTAKTSSGKTVLSLPNLIGPMVAGQVAVAG